MEILLQSKIVTFQPSQPLAKFDFENSHIIPESIIVLPKMKTTRKRQNKNGKSKILTSTAEKLTIEEKKNAKEEKKK